MTRWAEMDKREKRKYILEGIKNSFVGSLIALVIILVIAFIYAKIKDKSALSSIYMFYYGFAVIALIIAVPQLYKRNEDPRLRRIRRLSPLYGFFDWFQNQNPYEEKAMLESFEEFKGEGFWAGMFIVLFALLLFLYGFIFERIYFYIGR
jgi:glucan phosphoethanolaminetransferase (alkaline phosphatase superfamily)